MHTQIQDGATPEQSAVICACSTSLLRLFVSVNGVTLAVQQLIKEHRGTMTAGDEGKESPFVKYLEDTSAFEG